MANYAVIGNERLYLNHPRGIRFAEFYLGLSRDILEAITGRYTRGKRKGQLRGAIYYKKAIKGGWFRENGYGHVQYPGVIESSIYIGDAFTGQRI